MSSKILQADGENENRVRTAQQSKDEHERLFQDLRSKQQRLQMEMENFKKDYDNLNMDNARKRQELNSLASAKTQLQEADSQHMTASRAWDTFMESFPAKSNEIKTTLKV